MACNLIVQFSQRGCVCLSRETVAAKKRQEAPQNRPCGLPAELLVDDGMLAHRATITLS